MLKSTIRKIVTRLSVTGLIASSISLGSAGALGVDLSAVDCPTVQVQTTSNTTMGRYSKLCVIQFKGGTNSFTAPSGVRNISILVVGGGGGGGHSWAGGGGAGGVLHGTAYPVTAGTTYNLTVGAGGSGAAVNSGAAGSNGSDSTFGSLVAKGGGGGAGYGWQQVYQANGKDGGSGGGSGEENASIATGGASNQQSFANVTAYGNRGGNQGNNTGSQAGGGGGGAGGAGGDVPSNSNSSNRQPGAGGAGLSFGLGTTFNVAGGGGGGSEGVRGAAGTVSSTRLGGAGGMGTDSTNIDAVANTGSGGGGGHGTRGGNGSAGIVVVAFAYDVTYDANGATSGAAPSSQVKGFGTHPTSVVTVSGAGTLAKSGSSFIGWNTAADGTGTAYAAGSTYSADSSVTLYAQWSTAPAAPTNLVLTSGTTSVDLSWTAAANNGAAITNYWIEYKVRGGNWTGVVRSASTATSATVSGLVANSIYSFRVRAENSVGLGPWSQIRSVFTASGMQSFLDASDENSYAGSGTTWTDLTGKSNGVTSVNSPTFDATDKSFDLNGSNQYFTFGTSKFAFAGTQSFTLNALFSADTPGDNFEILFSRHDGGIKGSYYLGFDNSATDGLVGQRELSPWGLSGTTTLVANRKYLATYVYNGTSVQLYLNGRSEGSVNIGSIFDQDIIPLIGAKYYLGNPSDFFDGKLYSVSVFDTALTSAQVSAMAQALDTAPAAPTINSITATSQQLSVAFTAGANTGTEITKYQYSTDGGSTWRDRATGTTTSPLVISTRSSDNAALAAGTSYNVQIRAVNLLNGVASTTTTASTLSTLTSASAPSAAPTSGTLKSIDVSWTAVTNASSYTLKLYAANGTTLLQTLTGLSGTSKTITASDYSSLADNTTYQVSIQAVGTGSYETSAESTKTGVTTSLKLAAPGSLAVAPAAASAITVTFNSVANASSYTAQLFDSSGNQIGSNYTNFTSGSRISGLTASTTYSVKVMAIGNGTAYLSSDLSSGVSVTTSAAYYLKFAGTSSQMASKNAAVIPSTGDFTAEAWVSPSDYSASRAAAVIVSQGTASGNRFYLKLNSIGKLVFYHDSAPSEVTCSNNPIALDAWTHVAVSVSGTTGTCYVNGVAQISGTVGSATRGSSFYIGGYSAGPSTAGTIFAGLIDEVKIWNVARTATQIANNMEVAPAANDSTLVAYYPLDATSGTSAIDVKGVNDLTLGTTMVWSPLIRTITYQAGTGGSGTAITDSSPSDHSTVMTIRTALLASGLTRSGYTIQNWNTQANGTGTPYAFSTTYSGSLNLTLQAQWETNAFAPMINTQPISRARVSGEAVTLSVSASVTDGGSLTYQWQKDGVNIAGATATSYTINSVVSGDAGSYRVVVTNSKSGTTASTTSSAAKLVVAGINYHFDAVSSLPGGASSTGKSFKSSSAVIPNGSFTIEGWVQDKSTSTGQNPVFSQGSNGTNRLTLHIVGTTSRTLWLPGTTASIIGTTVLAKDKWHHYAVTYDGTTLRLYLNGVLEGSVNDTLNLTGSFFIGENAYYSGSNSSHFFHGKQDQLKIWNGVLSQSDIVASMYSYGNGGVTDKTLRSLYDFNQQNSSTVSDVLGGFDLTGNGAGTSTTWPSSSLNVTFDEQGGSSVTDTTFDFYTKIANPSTPTKANSTFSGWSRTSNGSVVTFPYSFVPMENVTLYAIWAANTYPITLNKGTTGTGSNQTLTKTHGQSLTLPDSTTANGYFTRTGYSVTGWSTSDGGSLTHALSGSFTTDSATTLYPVWTANTYTITLNRGTTGTGSNQTLTKTHAQSLTLPDSPTANSYFTRAGYTVSGWTTSDGGTQTHALSGSFTTDSATTLYPVWTGNTYTVTYTYNNADGGTRPITDSFTVGGSAISLPTPTRTGYTFAGWYAEVGLATLVGAAGASYSPASSTTIYAKWTANTYTITFAAGTNATGSNQTQTKTHALDLTLPNSATANGWFTRSGQTIVGWSATDGGALAHALGGAFTTNSATTLYPVWTCAAGASPVVSENLILRLDADNTCSTGTAGKWRDVSGNSRDLSWVNAPTLSTGYGNYYEFVRASSHYGSLASSGLSDFANGFSVTFWARFDSASGGAWERILDIGRGENSENIIVGREGTSNRLIVEFRRSSVETLECSSAIITDGEWAHFAIIVNSSGTCTIRKNGTSQTLAVGLTRATPYMPVNIERTSNYIGKSNWAADSFFDGGIGDIAIYNRALTSSEVSTNYAAQLATPSTYTITLNKGANGTGADQTLTKTNGQSLTLPNSATANSYFTRTGYTVTGWTTTDGGSQTHALGGSFTTDAATTLYPVWTGNTYTVTYTYNSANGGTRPVTDSFTVGGSAITLPTPTRTGYTFDGWYAEAGLSTLIGAAGASYSPSSNTTIYAKWISTLAITTPSSGLSGTLNQAYSLSISTSGGSGTNSFTLTGTLQTGLSINSSTGVISGTPSAAGNSSVTVTVTDSSGAAKTTNSFTISIALPACNPSSDTSSAPGYTILKFTSTGDCNWVVPSLASSAEVLVVAGGGGGAFGNNAGGGGAGEVLVTGSATLSSGTVSNVSPISLTPGANITITVGSGGTSGAPTGSTATDASTYWSCCSGSSRPGGTGGNSAFGTVTAKGGGGGGGGGTVVRVNGENGGSGGGGASGGTGGLAQSISTYSGWTSFKNNGAVGSNGGGGGAGAAPVAGSLTRGGAGVTVLGIRVAGGGGGWGGLGSAGSLTDTVLGGNGRLASGTWGYAGSAPNYTSPGTANTGTGGGGGAPGGSGVVVVRYQTGYVITYNYNSATGGNSTASDVFQIGGSALTLPTPTKTGSTFDGWYEAADFSGSAIGNTYSPTQSRTIYAKWSANQSTVTFNANDGSGSPATSTQSMTNSVATALTANAFTRTGYTFAGWNSLANGTGTNYTNQQSVTITGNMTLYAKWTANTYTITYTYNSADGGTRPATNTFTVGGSAITLPTPTRTGYTFGGWYAEVGLSTLIGNAGASYSPAANATIYAKWTANAYTVTYTYNSADGGTRPATDSFTVGGSAITLPTPTRTGYAFGGWYAEVGLSTSIGAAGASYSPTASVTIYAKWTANTYTVTYTYNSADGGTRPATDSFTVGGSAITLPTPTRTGYTFAGWYAEVGLSTLIGNAGASYSPTGSVTIYAKWTANSNTVTFKSNYVGGAVDSTQSIVTAVATGLTSNAFTRAGYVFSGWNTLANGTGTSYTDGQSVTLTGALTLYAKWSAGIYTVTYNYNSATGGASAASGNYTTGGTQLVLPVPTKTGYTFGGWYDASDFSGSALASSITTTSSKTIYAKWTAATFTVLYEYNGATAGDSTASSTYTTASTTITLPTPTKTGYTFAGWYESSNFSGSAVTTPYTTSQNRSLYAKWAAVSYTVTYNANLVVSGNTITGTGSVPVNNSTYNIGQSFSVAANTGPLTRSGYTFAGWVTNEDGTGTAKNSGETITFGAANINLYPKWTANTYTISYNLNGGSGDLTSAPTSWTVGNGNVTLPSSGFTRTGYDFAGWSKTQGGSVINNSFNNIGNVTLYAAWTLKSIAYTFDKGTAAGQTIASWPSNSSANFGSTITLPTPSNTVTINAVTYQFFGWEYSGTTYQPGSSFTLSETAPTFVAQWVRLYDVRYAYAGGTHSVAGDTDDECVTGGLCIQNQDINLRTAPTRAGYNFIGWRVQDTNTTKAAGALHRVIATGYLFYANWQAIDYDFSFNSSGGSESHASVTANIGQLVTMPNPGFKVGYTFAGWSPDNGTTKYTTGSTYLVSTASKAFVAYWTPNVYTVVYDWQGAAGTPTPDASYTVGTGALTLPLIGDRTKDGYTFGGWAESPGGTAVTNFTPTANDVLYAIWNDGNYTLSYDGRGASAGSGQGSVNRGSSVTLPTPVRAGFVFNGWYDDPTAGNKVGNGGASHTPGRSKTLYARWVQNSLHGVDPATLESAQEYTASDNTAVDTTLTHNPTNTSARIQVPSGALPNGTKVNVQYFKDTDRQSSLIPGNNSYFFSVLVSWLSGTGTSATVPNTAAGKPITVTLNNPSIKAGAMVYMVIGEQVTELGRATQDETVTVQLTQDPEIVVAATAPGNPASIVASSGDQEATVSWAAPSTNGGAQIVSYTVTANPGGATCTTATTSCTVTGLTNGNAYTFSVVATNSVGSSTGANSLSITPALATYTVTFNSNGGSNVSNGTFTSGGSVSEPTAPSRSGYTFDGWSTVQNSAASRVSFPYSPGVTNNITLYALWTQVQSSGGGGGSATGPTSTPTPTPTPTVTPGPTAPPSQIGFKPTPPPVPVTETGPVGSIVGSTEKITVVADAPSEKIIATAGDWKLEIKPPVKQEAEKPVTEKLELQFPVAAKAEIAGTGMQPNTTVEAWVFSQPRYLGTLKVGADGSFASSLTLPKDLLPGQHTLQIGSLNSQGRLVTISIPITIKGSVSVGTFRGFVSIFTKDLEGQQLTAKVAGKWITQNPIRRFKNFSYSRLVRLTGAGYDIRIDVYINKKFYKSYTTRTR